MVDYSRLIFYPDDSSYWLKQASFYMGAFVGASFEEEVTIVYEEEVGYGGGFPSNDAPMDEAPVLQILERNR